MLLALAATRAHAQDLDDGTSGDEADVSDGDDRGLRLSDAVRGVAADDVGDAIRGGTIGDELGDGSSVRLGARTVGSNGDESDDGNRDALGVGELIGRVARSRAAGREVGEVPMSAFEPGWDTACDCTDEELALTIGRAPALSAVIAAGLRAAGLASDPVPGWRTRSRWSALVPAITSRIGNSESWREVTDPTVSRALSYDVRVSWRLERLIYDPSEPRFTAFDISRRRERRHLIAITTHAYTAWLYARAAAGLAGEDVGSESRGEGAAETSSGAVRDGDPADIRRRRRALRRLIEAQAAHADLDALTDRWFSQQLAKPSRSR